MFRSLLLSSPFLSLIVVVAGALGGACGDSGPTNTTMREVHKLTGPEGTTEISLVANGATWQYSDEGADLGTDWRNASVAPIWSEGAAPLGYGEDYVATEISYGADPEDKNPTSYFRIEFTVDDPDKIESLYLRAIFDDGFVFYLNGDEGGRAWMPAGPVSYETRSTGHETGNNYMHFDISAQIPNLKAGSNSLAVEVHQVSAQSSDLTMDLGLIGFASADDDEAPPFVVTASGVPRGSVWKFWDEGGVASDWKTLGFDDSSWDTGRAPLGYGESYIQGQTEPGVITTYFRHEFSAERLANDMELGLEFDDGAVVYLNGVEIYRTYTMPDGAITETTRADWRENSGPISFLRANYAHLIEPGMNVVAVEVHQSSGTSSDLVFDAELDVADQSDWYAVFVPDADRSLSSLDLQLRDVLMLDEVRGVSTGYFREDESGSGFVTDVYRTADGGETWSYQSLPGQLSLTQIDAEPLPGGQSWLLSPDRGAAQVASSSDSGETWNLLATPGEVSEAVAILSSEVALVGANFPPAGQSQLYWTGDRGLTWQELAGASDIGRVQAIFRVDDSTALVATELGIYRAQLSADGSVSLQQLLDLSNPQEYFQSIHAFARQETAFGPRLWACGQNDGRALLLMSWDQGDSWFDVSPVMQPALNDCDFGDDGLGIAVTSGRVLLRTEDYGVSWHAIPSAALSGVSLQGTSSVAVMHEVIARSDCQDCTLDAAPPTADAEDCNDDAPVASWQGRGSRHPRNDRGAFVVADVVWELESSSGCVDQYRPGGTVETGFEGNVLVCPGSFEPASHAIDASDGLLTIDRTTQPWSYSVTGSSSWSREWQCDDGSPPPYAFSDGDWASGAGVSFGASVSGQLGTNAEQATCDAGQCRFAWSFEAVPE